MNLPSISAAVGPCGPPWILRAVGPPQLLAAPPVRILCQHCSICRLLSVAVSVVEFVRRKKTRLMWGNTLKGFPLHKWYPLRGVQQRA